MTALEHLSAYKCPDCNLYLFHVAQTKADQRDILFCSECGSGALYEDAIKKGKPLISGFLTKAEIQNLFGQMGIDRK